MGCSRGVGRMSAGGQVESRQIARGRSATLPELAGRIHAFEQVGEIAALDPDELDAAGRLEQAWIEQPRFARRGN